MGNFGVTEILLVLVVVLIIFGPGKLPELGKALGKAFGDFRRAVTGKKDKKKEP